MQVTLLQPCYNSLLDAVADGQARLPEMDAVVLKNGVVDFYSVLQVRPVQWRDTLEQT
jgi:hypothetical protein